MEKAKVLFVVALFAVISCIHAQDDIAIENGGQTAKVEEPAKKIHSLQPGEKEYLSPNLIGLQNIAITNIPLTMNLVNIIDAYREVVDGVRYEIVLNAVNTTDNNTEIICRIVVLEKPWLTNIWGDKLRLLQESNCTSQDSLDSERDSKILEHKYQSNALFSGSRNGLSADDMRNLEAQIIGSSDTNPQMTRQHTANSPTEPSVVIETTTINESELTATDSPIQSQSVRFGDADSSLSESPVTNTPTAVQQEEISRDDNLVDSTLSESQKTNSPIQNQEIIRDDIFVYSSLSDSGTTDSPIPQQEIIRDDSFVGSSLSDSGITNSPIQQQEIIRDDSFVEPSLSESSTTTSPIQLPEKRTEDSGVVGIPENESTTSTTEHIPPELNENEKKWLDDFLSVGAYHFERTNAEKNSQSANDNAHESEKMPIFGGPKPLTPERLKEVQQNFQETLAKLASGDSGSYSIESCESGTIQVVSGSLTKLKCTLKNSKTGKSEKCELRLWSQPWMSNGNELTIDCGQEKPPVHRYRRSVGMPGGVTPLSADELKAEQASLQMALAKLDSGESGSYSIESCESGTTQVVSGSLKKLKCTLKNSKTGKSQKCELRLWSQPWMSNGNELTIDCGQEKPPVHRYRRSLDDEEEVPVLGGLEPLSPEQLQEVQQSLQETLTKLASGDSESYSIESCSSGTTQVVSGSLTKLNCKLKSKTGKQDNCVLSLWSQPWLDENANELKIDCDNSPQSVHRYRRSVDDGHHLRPKGGPKPLTDAELKEQEGRVAQSLSKIASGDGPSYSILRTFNGTKQTVAGSMVKLFAELIEENTGVKENCTVSLWSRPWVPIDGYEVSFKCNGKPKSVHRHSRSIEYAEKKTNKKSHQPLDKAEHLFQKFQIKYKKEYHNGMERQMRLRIFKHNLKLIHDLNKNEMGSAKYGITEFADMTTTEYRDRTGLLSREEASNSVRTPAKIPDVELPREFDWREKGVISKVKNQGNCGSCWAFSVTGNIEGLHAVKTGQLEEYSEQELLDCDTIDSACNGGLPDDAYKAIENIGGLELESEYPYQAKKSQCHFNRTLAKVKVSGHVDLPKNETEMAKWLIVNGPISIGINANAMQFYRGGVSHPWKMLCSKKNLDHGVLIVGYGVSEYPTFKKTLPYWIVKNSWGPKWGEQGYYRVYRGDNTCGVSEMATSAVLAS